MILKTEIIKFWLTHHYLRKLGKFYPDFLTKLTKDITDNKSAQKVIQKRYIDNQKFEIIALDMNVDVRYVFRLHKQVIDKLIKI